MDFFINYLFIFISKMPKSKPITTATIKAVFKLRDEGKSFREIGNYFGYQEDWARKAVKRYTRGGHRIEPPAKPGRKRKFQPEVHLCVEQLAMRLRDYTSKGIANALQSSKVVDKISSSTVRSMLQKMEFRKVGAIRDVLTADHKTKRLAWCTEKQRQLIVNPRLFDDWVITDEVRISLDGTGVPQVKHPSESIE